jgi:hypothetical protein
MKIYFGDANSDTFSDGLFEQIFDGCKRKLPIHIEAIPELIAALQEVQKVDEAIRRAAELTERAESKTKGYVAKMWHDQFEVDFDTAE